MARLESVAIGGYYKTPSHLVPLIAQALSCGDYAVSICDPCAGDGEAVQLLSQEIKTYSTRYYTAELESNRSTQCRNRLRSDSTHIHGDAFLVFFDEALSNILYLNPPYDTDRVHGRLEQRFLTRFKSFLVDGGVLVYVVPYYALAASKEELGKYFEDVSCWRFPDEDYAAYKQVVLFGRKTTNLAPDPLVMAQVDHWVNNPDAIPVLGTGDVVYHLPYAAYGYTSWKLKDADFTEIQNTYRPWRFTSAKSLENVPHILPDLPVADILFREYPVATIPRPAHIAAGIASGMFNGRRIEPKTVGFPSILVKGVFTREFETIRENTNKDGKVTSVVQTQKPNLITTIFDLDTLEYRTLRNEGRTDGLETLEDLLEHYGPGLMTVMAKQCPVQYDPVRDSHKVQLASLGRKLYNAQEHATKALVTLLDTYQAGILIGEIGSGKTSCALAAAKTRGKNLLVMCPPHLLDSWKDEAKVVLPEAHVRVLESVKDVEALYDIPKDEFFVAILSRETAKLGHGVASVKGTCPKCGEALENIDYARKRLRCDATKQIPRNAAAVAAIELARKLFPYEPENSQIRLLLNQGIHQKRARLHAKADWVPLDPAWVEKLLATPGMHEHRSVMVAGLLSAYSVERVEATLNQITSNYNKTEIAFLLPPDSPVLDTLNGGSYPWGFPQAMAKYQAGEEVEREFWSVKAVNGIPIANEMEPNSKEVAFWLFRALCKIADFEESEPCGEFLYQAIPTPRRFPLAKYISKHHKKLFSVFVADECHEYATEGSAQEKAGHRMCNLKIPVILMTGSLMNGYAESLFTNMWAISEEFRKEFARTDSARFVDRYGYRERVVSDKDDKSGEVIEFGSTTDRVTRTARVTGDAPGVLPLFLFRHLLQVSVTLHKADLAIDLPKCTQHKHLIQPSKEQMTAYNGLLSTLLRKISRDRFEPKYAGKLFGALSEFPAYLDLAVENVGNQADGTYEIRYPETLDRELVATGTQFPYDELTPKEQWLIDTTKAELAEGRNVLVFAWHINLIPRLVRRLKDFIGEEVAVLYADKVPTKKRQEWITKNVVKKGIRVMVANPMTIQTGLNNLVHFSTEIWMENPGANPQIFRQAIGRVDRIGAKKETRIHFAVYEGTLQVQLYDLLMKKVAIATSTDGLDPESVLLASGGSSSYMTGLSIGRQLWEMLSADGRIPRAA